MLCTDLTSDEEIIFSQGYQDVYLACFVLFFFFSLFCNFVPKGLLSVHEDAALVILIISKIVLLYVKGDS